MPCFIALIVFSILGLFSASHRKFAKEAFDCVFRRVTWRPCNTGFDAKVKAQVLGPLLPRFPTLARFVSHHFEQLSWLFMILMTASTFYTVRGIYNFWAWGNCNGQYATGGFCAFDPTGENNKTSSQDGAECKDVGLASQNLSLKGVDTTLFPAQSVTPRLPEMFFIGCYSCDYTRKTYPFIKEILSKQRVAFTFAHYVTKKETEYLLPYDVCVEKLKPDYYYTYVDHLFSSSKEQVADEAYVRELLTTNGIGEKELHACLTDPDTLKLVQKQQNELAETGVYGTPTIFINGTPVVGPKPKRVYERLLRGSWF